MEFSKSKLFEVSNRKYLSELLNIELVKLKNIDKHFTVHPFKMKANDKIRELYNPSNEHKKALKNIVKMLSTLDFPEYLCGGVQNVSYVDNASRHLNSNYMLLLDITNFFPSTKDSYVYDFFHNYMNQPTDIAKILVNLTTAALENHRHLPQGYSTSPILSFLAYHKMYQELNEFAIVNNFTFSAYYDDFTFSSATFIDPSKRRAAIKIIRKYNLDVNSKKTKLTVGNHVKVTGVIIDKDERKAPKKLFRKTHNYYLKLLVMDKDYHFFNQDDFIDTCNKFQGCLAAIQYIEPDRNLTYYYNKLRYIRKKFNVPIEKKNKEKHFNKIPIKA